MKRFLTDNSTEMRLARTIVQGVIGVIVAYADVIVGTFSIEPSFKPVIVAVVMAILSPVMAALGGDDESR